jgi:hypothetical protein
MAFVPIHRSRPNELEDRRRIVQAFRKAQAVSAGSARTASALALGPLEQVKMFARLQHWEIVRSLPGGRYYLDEDRLKEANVTVARIGLTVAFVVFLIIVTVLALRP